LDVKVVRGPIPTLDKARDYFDGRLPHFVYIGFGGRNGCENIVAQSEPYLDGRVLLVAEIGDAQFFQRKAQWEPWSAFISVLVGRMPADWMGYQDLFASAKVDPETQYLRVPWGVDETLYCEAPERDIDVSMVCSKSPHFRVHTNRVAMDNVLREWFAENATREVCTSMVFDSEYREVIGRSKIVIVDTSNRQALTQKYVEGAAAGALLMGDLPYDPEGLFEPGVSFVVSNPETLAEDLDLWLSEPEELARVAAEGQRRVLGRHRLSEGVRALSDYFHTTLRGALHEI
tara:strand:- start:436 stop:1299 length:864 start_codon:yes stop_codon:yes gene_type:complete